MANLAQFQALENCVVSVACKQFRCLKCTKYSSNFVLHRSSCTFFLCCNSDPIIEESTRITIAPYNLGYPLIDKHMEAAKVDPSILCPSKF